MNMRSTSCIRVAAAALGLALGAVPLVVAPALAKPSDAIRRRAFSLFALPTEFMQVNNIFCPVSNRGLVCVDPTFSPVLEGGFWPRGTPNCTRSEEHTSELQSLAYLVCRLLLE